MHTEVSEAFHQVGVELAARRNADLERAEYCRALVTLGRFFQAADRFGRLLQIAREARHLRVEFFR